jgi:hypothetical protein
MYITLFSVYSTFVFKNVLHLGIFSYKKIVKISYNNSNDSLKFVSSNNSKMSQTMFPAYNDTL